MIKNRNFWNDVIYGLGAWLYGLGLTALLANLLGQPFDWSQFIFWLTSWTLIWLVVVSFPKVSLAVTVLGIGGLILLFVTNQSLYDRFLSSRLFWELESHLRAVLYFVGIPGYLVPPLDYFTRSFALVASLVSVVLVWRLGWYFLGFVVLAAPLFFQLGFAGERWQLWLAIGLLGLLILASRRIFVQPQARRLRQWPAFGLIAILLLMTFGLASLLPDKWFFHTELSRWVNEVDDLFQDPYLLNNRGLFTMNGGYFAESSPINGLVNRTSQPYLKVYGPMDSFYLRGSIYTDYRNKTWYATDTNIQTLMQRPATLDQQQLFDPFYALSNTSFQPSNLAQESLNSLDFESLGLDEMQVQEGYYSLFFPKSLILIQPLQLPQPLAYVLNVPSAIRSVELVSRPGEHDQFNILDPDPQSYRYTPSGMIFRDNVTDGTMYVVAGGRVSVDIRVGEEIMEAMDMVPVSTDPSGQSVTQRPLGAGIYQATVAQHDPTLARILYGNSSLIDKVIRARDHIGSTYRYDLDVAAVPSNQDFIEWFVQNKVGYCVHYATGLALLLEDAGIATRYVEGFMTGRTPVLGSTNVFERTITTDQAHAWTEVYLNQLGWYPFDATPASETGQDQVVSTPLYPSGVEAEETPEAETTEPTQPQPDRIETDSEAGLGNNETSESQGPTEPVTIPWGILSGLALVLFFGWRYWVYKMRHNRNYLLKRYQGRSDELVRRIFRDIQHLHVIGGYSIPRTWSSKQRFDDVIDKTSALDYDNTRLAEQAIEQVYYAERLPSEEQLIGLMSYHAKLETRVRYKLKLPEWWLRRFLWSPHHPL